MQVLSGRVQKLGWTRRGLRWKTSSLQLLLTSAVVQKLRWKLQELRRQLREPGEKVQKLGRSALLT